MFRLNNVPVEKCSRRKEYAMGKESLTVLHFLPYV